MKSITDNSIPILLKLGKDNWWNLDANERVTLSAWIAMFVMTYEHADRETIAVSNEERAHLMLTAKAPDNWKIWIGRFDGVVASEAIFHRAFTFLFDEEPVSTKPNSQTTTFQFGKLIVSCFSTTAYFDFDVLEYGRALGLHTLWPLNDDIIAKPIVVHDDDGAETVGRAFTEDMLGG